MDVPFDLTCWYVNQRRVLELVGPEPVMHRLRQYQGAPAHLMKKTEEVVFKDAVTEWLRRTNPPTLGKILSDGTIREGVLFTHFTNYFFKGLSEVRKAIEHGKSPKLAQGYAKLDEFRPGLRVGFGFHHEHLLSDSAWGWLSGQQRLLMLGLITKIEGDLIEALPYVIANPLPDITDAMHGGYYWANRLEVHVDTIASFARVRDVAIRRTKADLQKLKAVPEDEVKRAIAEIIGEPMVPKDWGGERSDLFTSRLLLDRDRVSAAFAFKGPAKFGPLTLASMGKNGDQIDRLFSEPADLFVVQHCHEITKEIRGTMRAYAQQMGRPRLFCLIDGYDTIRLLSAHGKCGFRSDGTRG